MPWSLMLSPFFLMASLTDLAPGLMQFDQVIARTSANSAGADLTSSLPGHADDARIARIAWRLAVAGGRRCPARVFGTGIVLQHLMQFQPQDRAGLVSAFALDQGPGVVAVTPGTPAALAGILPGDVLLAVDGEAIPPELGTAAPFDWDHARARADAVLALLDRPQPYSVTLLRSGHPVSARLAAVPTCRGQVDLVQSSQRNAYADGHDVFLTTALVALVRSDDELAFVIAHEMGHNILGDAETKRQGPGRGSKVVRGTEDAADALGALIARDAGYDAVRGADILTRLGSGYAGIRIFATHASARARIAAIRTTLAAPVAPSGT